MRIVGIGVDVVEVDRVKGLLERHPRFRDRVFTPEEIAYCERKYTPAECYAARWAAREACIKALGGIRGVRWRDIRVERAPSGAPALALAGAARERAEAVGASEVLVSLGHERSVATAFCVAVGP
ncbi:MAG TPA: holo-ACP synthase [Actinomycetota bacterium]|nr:holo-ACP synthase [Actinomycetota bacterium]